MAQAATTSAAMEQQIRVGDMVEPRCSRVSRRVGGTRPAAPSPATPNERDAGRYDPEHTCVRRSGDTAMAGSPWPPSREKRGKRPSPPERKSGAGRGKIMRRRGGASGNPRPAPRGARGRRGHSQRGKPAAPYCISSGISYFVSGWCWWLNGAHRSYPLRENHDGSQEEGGEEVQQDGQEAGAEGREKVHEEGGQEVRRQAEAECGFHEGHAAERGAFGSDRQQPHA